MRNWLITFITVSAALIFLLGCSSSNNSPIAPGNEAGVTTQQSVSTPVSDTRLWGYYDVYLDIDTETIEAIPNRNTMFTADINTFLNNKPPSLGFTFNQITQLFTMVDVDLNVLITHPIPGAPGYNGYDVRGAFIGNGSGTMKYKPASNIQYPIIDGDQTLIDDPINLDGGGPDGYTRWFNIPEFTTPGLFGYKPGIYASASLISNANLNPYKYFATDLSPQEDLYSFLLDTGDTNEYGVFLSGATLSRNYYIRFPIPIPGLKFGYVIMANWGGAAPNKHPSNAIEAVACDMNITEDLYWTPSESGGDLILDFSLFAWNDQLPSQIIIESNVLINNYMLSPSEMTPTATGENWATWHVSIPANNLTGLTGNTVWVIAEYSPYDYSNTFGVPNLTGGDVLASYFRYSVPVGSEVPNDPPEIIDGINGDPQALEDDVITYTVTATDPDMDPLTYDWSVVEQGVGIELMGGAGDGMGGFQIDWALDIGAALGDIYDITCSVTDSVNPPVFATMLSVEIVEEVNLPPVIESGVNGNSTADPTSTSAYTVTAYDPEAVPLIYGWSVVSTVTSEEVFSGPGDGIGGFTVDWTVDVGASLGQVYDIECKVSDGVNPQVEATPLTVLMEETPNSPPEILDGVSGLTPVASDAVETYTVDAFDADADPLTFEWEVQDDMAVVVFSGPGDGTGNFEIDWTNDIGAVDGEIYTVYCDVNDSINPPVSATPLEVTIQDFAGTTLYLYDGTVNDGGITIYDLTGDPLLLTWQYCPGIQAWDEDECGPYGIDEPRIAATPLITFPDVGSFTTIHLEIWHWGDMQDDSECYGSLATISDTDEWRPNWYYEELVYIEGFNFNDGDWADWSFIFGSEAAPEWSHFNANAYAGNQLRIAFAFGEYGDGNPLNQDGWMIRKLHVWYE